MDGVERAFDGEDEASEASVEVVEEDVLGSVLNMRGLKRGGLIRRGAKGVEDGVEGVEDGVEGVEDSIVEGVEFEDVSKVKFKK